MGTEPLIEASSAASPGITLYVSQRMSNAERYNKMKESRERTRLRLTAATEQIARLEAELKVAKMQQDNGAEAQV